MGETGSGRDQIGRAIKIAKKGKSWSAERGIV
jgi:hypothetical protein